MYALQILVNDEWQTVAKSDWLRKVTSDFDWAITTAEDTRHFRIIDSAGDVILHGHS